MILSLNLYAQHTFSIVAVDSITNEIGSAGATCLLSEDGALYVSDIVLGVGGINTQAWWTTVNQNAARQRMEDGLSPQEIIDWLGQNDNSSQGGNFTDRQYGIVDLNNGSPRSAAFTGTNNFDVKGQRTGANYAIQGNILISEDVLTDMETAFLTTEGPLCEKLMATMQAAKRPGADARCLSSNISSASAYIRVAKPTDTDSSYGNLWLDLNAWLDSGEFTGDPIDELQNKFNAFKLTVDVDELSNSQINVYPNPTSGQVTLEIDRTNISKIELFDMLGNQLMNRNLLMENSTSMIDLSDLMNGQYILKIWYGSNAKNSFHIINKVNGL